MRLPVRYSNNFSWIFVHSLDRLLEKSPLIHCKLNLFTYMFPACFALKLLILRRCTAKKMIPLNFVHWKKTVYCFNISCHSVCERAFIGCFSKSSSWNKITSMQWPNTISSEGELHKSQRIFSYHWEKKVIHIKRARE